MSGVDGENQRRDAERIGQFLCVVLVDFSLLEQRGANDHFVRPGLEKASRGIDGANTASDLAMQSLEDRLHQSAVVSGAASSVEIDELHQRIFRKAVNPILNVRELQFFLFALHKLDDLPAHEVDRGNQ